MLSLNQLSLSRGNKILFENVSFIINHHSKVGVIGANGSGKSSLFALIQHQLEATHGSFKLPNHTQIAYLSQETPASDKTALEYVLDGDIHLRQLQADLIQAEVANDHQQQAKLHSRLEEIDGYRAPARAATLLHGLGFSHQNYSQAVKKFLGAGASDLTWHKP